jgi:hypothetical protein
VKAVAAIAILVVVLGGVALAAAFAGTDVVRVVPTTGSASPPRQPARPKPPADYAVPRRAVRVSSSAQLTTALANPGRRNIVLAPGVYDRPGPFSSPSGHRIYAARRGTAVLKAGISVGASSGGSGALLRGLVFDVREPAKTLNGAIVEVWGTATNVQVLDTVLRGNGRVTTGILARQPAGFVAKRIVSRNFTDYGVVVDANQLGRRRSRPGFLLEDLDVANVARRPPRSSNGAAEACVWIGEGGVARRIRVRNCGWMGIWTGTSATGTVVEDVDVDRTRTGVYIEHFTRDSTFQRVLVRSRVRIGIVAEWASPGWGRRPASVDNVIQDSTFESYLCGVYLDEGTTRTTVRRSAFRNQMWAAIGDFRGKGNRFSRNDYSGIRRAAVPVSHEHVSAARERD